MNHFSVMKEECLELLAIKPDGIYLDLTLGRAGHSKKILKKLTTGKIYGFDKDNTAIIESQKILQSVGENFTLIHSDFTNVIAELDTLGVKEVDGVLMDLGVSSGQFDDSTRGFSYRFDNRLDMRMDQRQKLSAYEVVNEYSLTELTAVIRNYGEERFAYQIARGIINKRPLTTTFELVEVIKKALPAKELIKKGHPAKKTFQALRIEVNQELNNLKVCLPQVTQLLKPQARLVVLTFHSLEDRIVKQYFNSLCKIEVAKGLPLKANEMPQAKFKMITKKALVASKEELQLNNRSRSAKLRVIERK